MRRVTGSLLDRPPGPYGSAKMVAIRGKQFRRICLRSTPSALRSGKTQRHRGTKARIQRMRAFVPLCLCVSVFFPRYESSPELKFDLNPFSSVIVTLRTFQPYWRGRPDLYLLRVYPDTPGGN